MSVPDRAELARRLFASVRRQRPSAELEARILAAGRAELDQSHLERPSRDARGLLEPRHPEPSRDKSELDAHGRSEEALDALGSARRQRAHAIGARGWLGVSALAAVAAGLFVYLGPGHVPERGVLISAERSGTAALPRESSASEARSRDITPASRGTGSESERAGAPLDAEPADAKPADARPADAKPAGARPADANPAATGRALPAPAKPERTPSTPAAPRASLGQQLEQIKEARAALRAGEHRRAIELLEAYRTQPAGAEMAAEASLLRIQALAASGQRDAAAQAARQFASDYPNSPLIDRALSYAGGAER